MPTFTTPPPLTGGRGDALTMYPTDGLFAINLITGWLVVVAVWWIVDVSSIKRRGGK